MLRWDLLVTEAWGDTILWAHRVDAKRARLPIALGSATLVAGPSGVRVERDGVVPRRIRLISGATRRLQVEAISITVELVPSIFRSRKRLHLERWFDRPWLLVDVGIVVLTLGLLLVRQLANPPNHDRDLFPAIAALVDWTPDGLAHGCFTSRTRGGDAAVSRSDVEPPCDRQELKFGGNDTRILGAFDASTLRDVFEGNRDLLDSCYERELPADSDLDGELILRFEIRRDGLVDGMRVVRSSMRHRNFARCEANLVESFVFPRPGATVTVEYPIATSHVHWGCR